jgi:hypothetical protein
VQLVLSVAIVAAAIWVLALGFVLALARTAKSADRAVRHLVIPQRGAAQTPHPVVR